MQQIIKIAKHSASLLKNIQWQKLKLQDIQSQDVIDLAKHFLQVWCRESNEDGLQVATVLLDTVVREKKYEYECLMYQVQQEFADQLDKIRNFRSKADLCFKNKTPLISIGQLEPSLIFQTSNSGDTLNNKIHNLIGPSRACALLTLHGAIVWRDFDGKALHQESLFDFVKYYASHYFLNGKLCFYELQVLLDAAIFCNGVDSRTFDSFCQTIFSNPQFDQTRLSQFKLFSIQFKIHIENKLPLLTVDNYTAYEEFFRVDGF